MEELDESTRDKRHKLIIIDDLMHAFMWNKNMELLFTQGTHHKCVSVILIAQNLYPGGKHARTIAWYMVLMKNLGDVSQVSILGRQLYPGKSKGFLQAYKDALNSNKFGYFVVDMSPHAEDVYRLRSLIFPGEDPIIFQLTQERARVRVTCKSNHGAAHHTRTTLFVITCANHAFSEESIITDNYEETIESPQSDSS